MKIIDKAIGVMETFLYPLSLARDWLLQNKIFMYFLIAVTVYLIYKFREISLTKSGEGEQMKVPKEIKIKNKKGKIITLKARGISLGKMEDRKEMEDRIILERINKEINLNNNSVYVGFMRMITLNFKLFCKPVELGWRRIK